MSMNSNSLPALLPIYTGRAAGRGRTGRGGWAGSCGDRKERTAPSALSWALQDMPGRESLPGNQAPPTIVDVMSDRAARNPSPLITKSYSMPHRCSASMYYIQPVSHSHSLISPITTTSVLLQAGGFS